MTLRQRSILFLLINTVVWGAALPISKSAVEAAQPVHFLFSRYVLAALFSWPLLLYYWPKIKHRWQVIGKIVALELLGTTVALGLLYEGLSRTSSIEASLITTTVPIFVVVGGILFLREKQEKHEWFGLALAFGGTLMLALEPLLTGRTQSSEFSFLGNLLVIGQNITISAYYLLAKKLYVGIPKFFITAVSFYVGILSFGALSMWKLGLSVSPFLSLTRELWNTPAFFWPSLYMAIGGSIIGLTMYIWGQEGMEASEASLFTYLQPLVYLPMGIIFLGEGITFWLTIAVLLIACGVFVSERRGKKRRQTPLPKSVRKSRRNTPRSRNA